MGEVALMRWMVAFLTLAACATVPDKPEALTIEQIYQQKVALNGQRIRVEGVVRECRGLSCGLWSPTNRDHFLSIGSSDQFDVEIQPVLRRKVIVEATFNNFCISDLPNDEIALCGDRARTLENPVLIWPNPK